MPTRSGWSLAGVGGLTLIAGRVFALPELLIVGVAFVTLAVAATIWVATRSVRLEVARVVRPARLHAGGDSEVVLALRNAGSRRTPVLGLHDEVRGTAGATVLAAPLERGARSTAAYTLPTARRGRVEIGPLTVELGDPFGLARTTVAAAGRTSVMVYPQVVTMAAPPRTGGADPHGRRSRGLHHEGDEFHALRPYVRGDDLRRVHWPATARTDELVVRQLELHRHGRTTVLLDDRPAHHTGSSFELAVIAAASVLTAAHERGDEVRLLSAGGHDSGLGDDRVHLDVVLSWLAVVEARSGVDAPAPTPQQGRPLRITTDIGLRSRGGGPAAPSNALTTIVVVTDPVDPAPRPGLLHIRRAQDLARSRPMARPRPRAVVQ